MSESMSQWVIGRVSDSQVLLVVSLQLVIVAVVHGRREGEVVHLLAVHQAVLHLLATHALHFR